MVGIEGKNKYSALLQTCNGNKLLQLYFLERYFFRKENPFCGSLLLLEVHSAV